MTASVPSNPLQLERPIKVTISYTHTCNLDCRVCYADCSAAHAARELSGETWRRVIDDLLDIGVISVMFEGGEPLHRPDFLGVLAHTARRAYVKLRTNATLVDPALAAALKRAGTGVMLVDLLGASPDTHDALTGSPGSFARSVQGIRALMDAGLPTTVLVILNRANVGELQPILELAHRLGVHRIGVLRPYPLGRMRRAWPDLSLSLEEMTGALAALRVPEGLDVMQSWHPNDANCCWQMAAINARGESVGCLYLRDYVNFGDVAERGLLETWMDPLYRTLREGRVEQSCGTCSASQKSHGGCRSTAYAFLGRWGAPDPFCSTLNNGVDLRVLPALPQA